ncbi:diguanylate cyclase [Kineosporia sp. NBRC 101731]|uniref:diguanylate cyclase domain-containing protein n=1 Tax=Kineosporia sp. NBRC 101731 TaxID=3032199 RepID=UPI0025555FA6|nr:diguanylate cyclase [Kineosporia sp. NBRC 101731]
MTAQGRLTRDGGLLVGCLLLGLGVSEFGIRLLRDPALPVSVWWPLSGLGVALLARLRPRSWPITLVALATGQLVTRLSTYYASLESALLVLGAGLGETLVISLLLRRAFPGGVLLDSPLAAVRFAGCAVGGVMCGATVFALTQDLPGGESVPGLWNGYLRSHCLGLLMVSPLFLVSADAGSLLREVRRHRLNLEWAAQAVVLGLTTAGVFLTDQRVVPDFVCAVPLIWGGLRLGPARAMGSLLLMAVITTVGALRGVGPVVQEPPAAQTFAIQAVLVSATLCTLFVVLAAQARSRLLERTRADGADLVAAEQIAGLGSSTWDLDSNETRWSAGMFAQIGREPGSVAPAAQAYLELIHPDDRGVVIAALSRAQEGIGIPDMQFRLLRPDGTERTLMARNRLDRHPDGRPARVRSTVLDVTEMRQAELDLQQAHTRLAGVLDAVEDVAIVGCHASSLLITFFSRGAEQMLGWRADEVVGIHRPSIYHDPAELERAGATEDEQLLGLGEQVIRTGHSSTRWTCVRRDGSRFPAQGSLTRVLGPDGQAESFIAVIVDLTQVLRAQADLQESEDRFRLAFDFAPMAMAVVMLEEGDPPVPGRIERANPALCRFTALSGAELVGRHLADLMTPAHAALATTDLQGLLLEGGDSATAERAFHRADGSEAWGLLSTSVVRPADGPPYLITMIEDITARMQLTERLRHEASHDPLTGLPNRQVLRRRLEDALGEAPVDGPVAVLYVDLDGFKAVNDTLGHGTGDGLLVQVADRIAGCVRSTDVVARLGGDEFAVLLPRVGHLDTARTIGERIVRALAAPFTVEGSACRIGASIGIALSTPEDTQRAGDSVPQLLNAADEAMYEAKRSGRGRVEVSAR